MGELLERAGYDVDIVELGFELPPGVDRSRMQMHANIDEERVMIASRGFHEAVRIRTNDGVEYFIDPISYVNYGTKPLGW